MDRNDQPANIVTITQQAPSSDRKADAQRARQIPEKYKKGLHLQASDR
ncbi:hypothetical protein O9X99_18275 [Agrobacterium salinitolerans]|nr:hypothetical protein [Agrobacterium salinitolerans]MCZ7852537.1 hypothetical protein [Agrobacterium salinitolerans]MCZ7893623.1 hypothetical protein [Agrobacterium salinitolerans]MCZ7976184.1 hypothetical protein [Agrobacterium salinitolerans]